MKERLKLSECSKKSVLILSGKKEYKIDSKCTLADSFEKKSKKSQKWKETAWIGVPQQNKGKIIKEKIKKGK